jgi:hypothetical protein
LKSIDKDRHIKLNELLLNLSDFDYDMVYALVERLSSDTNSEQTNDDNQSDQDENPYGQDYIDSLDEDSFKQMLGDDYLERLMHWRND